MHGRAVAMAKIVNDIESLRPTHKSSFIMMYILVIILWYFLLYLFKIININYILSKIININLL